MDTSGLKSQISNLKSAAAAPPRRGSVLLVVVVLLLLLAILGTSYLATTRVDREISAQDLTNTNIDAVMDGVRDLAMSQIVSSMYALNIYNTTNTAIALTPPLPTTLQNQYQFRGTIPPTPINSLNQAGAGATINAVPSNNFDVPVYAGNNAGDPWLSDRAPQVNVGNANPCWEAITAPMSSGYPAFLANGGATYKAAPTLTAAIILANSTGAFEDPTTGDTYNPYFNTTGVVWSPTNPNPNLPAYPTFVGIYPALSFGGGKAFVAGDADGDGIADCGLFRLPGVYADGLTYYAGVRIIDNNSAVNVNTAWDYQYDFAPNGDVQPYTLAANGTVTYTPPMANAPPATTNLFPSLYTSAVGLNEMLFESDMGGVYNPVLPAYPPVFGPQALNEFRFGGTVVPYTLTGYPAGMTTRTVGATTTIDAYDDSLTPGPPPNYLATDFGYATMGDQLYHQLGRRPGNPGYVDGNGNHFRAFSDADEADLVYHFGLLNTATFDATMYSAAGVPTTSLQSALPFSAYADAPNYPRNGPPFAAARHKATNGYPVTATSLNARGSTPAWKSYPPTANALAEWYVDNFSPATFPVPNTAVAVPANLRPFLVTRNPVSNQVPMNSPSTTVLTVSNAAMVPYGDRGRWQPNVLYTASSNILNNGVYDYVSDDCVTFAAGTATTTSKACIIPADTTTTPISSGAYSGVFFCRSTPAADPNVDHPPTGLLAELKDGPANLANYQTVTGITPPIVYWARPTYWTVGRSYNNGDYVYADATYLQSLGDTTAVIDGNRFYRAINAAAVISTNTNYPTLGTVAAPNPDWIVWQPPSWATATKANVNAASFPELFRAYWNVMAANSNGTLTTPFGLSALSPLDIYDGNGFVASYPFNAANSTNTPVRTYPQPPQYFHQQRMFRSPVRDNRPLSANQGMYFDPYQVLQLRAAIAAANTENMREPAVNSGVNPSANNVIARQVPLLLTSLSPAGSSLVPVNAVVYGNQPGVCVAEVYAQTDPTAQNGNTNQDGYVAVELYNPNAFAISMAGWEAAIANAATGHTTAPYPTINLQPLAGTFPASLLPHQLLLLENYNAAGGAVTTDPFVSSQAATYRPASSGMSATGPAPAGVVDVFVPALAAALQPITPLINPLVPPSTIGYRNELVILKPRVFAGTPTTGLDGPYSWSEIAATPTDYVPVDSFDFTGINTGSAILAEEWHYVRITTTGQWLCTYPGRYNGSLTTGGHQQGTISQQWNPTNNPDPGFSNGSGAPAVQFGTQSTTASYPLTYQVQLTNPIWAGPNRPQVGVANGNVAPLGGFARNGDILEVPFVAAYRIEDMNGNIIELNSASMDCSFAEDTNTTLANNQPPDYTLEQIGRFCPLIPVPLGVLGNWDDTKTTQAAAAAAGTNILYGWAQNLFSYLTVQDPHGDYFPDTDPSMYPPASIGSLRLTTGASADTANTNNYPPPYPTPVANSNSDLADNLITNSPNYFTDAANTEAENTQGVDGLVNLNTAPLQVLEALPLVVTNAGVVDTSGGNNNEAMANAIIQYRQGVVANAVNGVPGPFTSIFDLNNVQIAAGTTFQNDDAHIPAFTGTSTAGEGNLTPGQAGITNEFDETYLQINRLSNLITTRSDTFTVYIVVEGWQNAGNAAIAGAAPPKLVVTRRMAYIVDRNGLSPTSKSVKVIPVDNN